MKLSKEYKIPFKGLKLGKHNFEYFVENKFFDAYKFDDYIETAINIAVDFIKKETLFELYFTMQGTVRVNCDVSGEEFDLPVENDLNLLVKFGEVFNDDDEQILIIPHNDFELDLSQYIFEMIVLSVPSKRLHPGVVDGTLHTKAMDKLKEMNTINKTKIDPRWEKLKGLIKDK